MPTDPRQDGIRDKAPTLWLLQLLRLMQLLHACARAINIGHAFTNTMAQHKKKKKTCHGSRVTLIAISLCANSCFFLLLRVKTSAENYCGLSARTTSVISAPDAFAPTVWPLCREEHKEGLEHGPRIVVHACVVTVLHVERCEGKLTGHLHNRRPVDCVIPLALLA